MGNSEKFFERLKQKSAYEKFISDNKDAFLYAIFCIISKKEKEGDNVQFDFYIPSMKKIGHSEYPFDSIKVQNEQANFRPEVLDLREVKIDLENIEDAVQEAIKKNGESLQINKIIGVLRKGVWDVTCLTQSMVMLRIKIDSASGECREYKRENLTELISIKKAPFL
jgi:hypothetical protein